MVPSKIENWREQIENTFKSFGVTFRNCSCIVRQILAWQSWVVFLICSTKFRFGRTMHCNVGLDFSQNNLYILMAILYFVFLDFGIWILVETTLSKARVSLLLWLKGWPPSPPPPPSPHPTPHPLSPGNT